jgi:hypothetical protein
LAKLEKVHISKQLFLVRIESTASRQNIKMGSAPEQFNQRLELHEEKGQLILTEKGVPKPPADGCILKVFILLLSQYS